MSDLSPAEREAMERVKAEWLYRSPHVPRVVGVEMGWLAAREYYQVDLIKIARYDRARAEVKSDGGREMTTTETP